jgi:GH25 family lysozyme M1 (1,4-beta-N-acetylmuramidase)
VITRPGCLAAIDVSAAQGRVDGYAVAAAGVAVAFVELGIGNDAPNPDRAAQVAALAAAGIDVRGYSFCYPLPAAATHPGRDPIAQAGAHVALAREIGLDAKPLVADVEWPPPDAWGTWGVTAESIRAWVLAYLAEVERLTGITPWVYVAPGFAESIQAALSPELSRYPLWVAHWGVSSPDVPLPWSDWTAWQWSATGRVEGVTGPVDLSWVRALPPDEQPTRPSLAPVG